MVKIFIIGNGNSTKKIINFGFENFIKLLKKNNFIIICMNKILKFFEKENIKCIPDYYVAGDVQVNISMYSYIIKFKNLFKKCYIGMKNHSLSNKKIINELSKFENINIINHTSTGSYSLKLALNMKPSEIYMIGMDENYNFCDKFNKTSLTIKDIPNINDNYFFNYYIEDKEIFSRVLSNRKNTLKLIIDKISKTTNIYNLSNISTLKCTYLSFNNFLFNLK